MNLQTKIINKITWKLFGYSISNDTFTKLFLRRFWMYIGKFFKIGQCQNCGRITSNKNSFCDSDGDMPYQDYCCDDCYDYLLSKI